MSLRDRLRRWLGVTVAAAPVVRQAMRISDTALSWFRKPATVNPFMLPKPPPGVSAGPKMAMDDAFIGPLYSWAAQNAWGEGLQFMGYPYLAELTQRPEYRRPTETLAMEMTRKWIKITVAGDDKTSNDPRPIVDAVQQLAADKGEKVKQLEQALVKFKVQDAFRQVAELDGFFGRSHLYIDTGDTDRREELETALVISKAKIKKGGLKALRVIEPMWVYPNVYNSSDPMRADYFKPTSWFVMNKCVHSTRLMRFVSREVPDILKPAYSFGGLSLSQIAKPYVDNWLRTRQSVSDITHSYSTPVLKTNLADILSGGQGQQMFNRAELFNQTRDNRGLMMIDKDTEEFDNISTPLSELSLLQAQSQEHMAAVVGIPLTILLGITPSGLNASSEGEIRTFYAWIEALQEALFREPLQKVLEIIQLSEFGDIDPEIGFEFNPLWTQSDLERADIRDKESQTAERYVNAGVLSPEEERKRLAEADGSLYAGLDLSETPEAPEPEFDNPDFEDQEQGGE